jgi:alpha-amylase
MDSELGCAADWEPSCHQAQLVLDPADHIWRLTADLAAGHYEYKAALNRSWDVSYGAGGQRLGPTSCLNTMLARSPSGTTTSRT